ncbi:MAG: 1,4-dihydroxy-2-naphthoate octaprenyltransferase [Negativicutes bacterium]|nr:1,4-dihydroxy-2-naphthoate octaprenyltransferase [Negativicutes bacterium]
MLNVWFMALRPWSYTAAFVPVALGAALAESEGVFNLGLFLLTLIGGIAMQAGTNLINTYGDYMSGVDTLESATTCPQLVSGVLTPSAVRTAGISCFGFATLIGLYLTYLCGWPIIIAGLIGLIGGYCYTAGFSYKYKGLGSIMVFFLMGPLMAWPSYFIQTGQFSWLPVWVSLPIGFLVAAILHANDLRDMAFDRKAGIQTLALFLGLQKSINLYYFLYSASFVCLVGLVLLSFLPWEAILPVLLIPSAIKMVSLAKGAAQGSREAMLLLEATAAQFHFAFGLLLIVGLAAHSFAHGWYL